MQLVDSVAYKYGSLRPPPPSLEDQQIIEGKKLLIRIDTTFQLISSFKTKIEEILKASNSRFLLDKYGPLLKSSIKNISVDNFNLAAVSKRGKYVLVEKSSLITDPNAIFVGTVRFSEVLHNANHAIYIATISTGPKSGIVWNVFADKVNGQWQIFHKEYSEIW